jgi:isoamylase
LSWFDWKGGQSPEGRELADVVARLLSLRRAYPVLRWRHFMHSKEELAPGLADISWFDQHGEPISEEAWHNPEERTIVLRRAARNLDGAISALTLIMNPTVEKMTFRLPAPHMPTRVLVDSDKPHLAEHDIGSHEIVVAGRSAVLVSGINQTMS